LQKENAKLKAAPGKAAAVKSADVEDLEEEIAELNGLVQKLSQDVSNLQADKADLEKELQKAQSGKGGGGGGNQAKLQEENEGLRNQMEDLERHLDELEATIASKNKTIRELETKVKAGGGGGGGGKGGAETEELKKKLQLMEGVLEGAAFFPPLFGVCSIFTFASRFGARDSGFEARERGFERSTCQQRWRRRFFETGRRAD